MTDSKKIKLAVLQHKNISIDKLIQTAQSLVPSQFVRRKGKNAERYKSYWSARCALKSILGNDAQNIKILPNEAYGYPYLTGIDGTFVSLGHTDTSSVACLGPVTVGVDIERIDRDASKVMKRVCTPDELQWKNKKILIDGKNISTELALWTLKEAFSKALGLGMKFGFQSFEILSFEGTEARLKTNIVGPLYLKDPLGALFCLDDYLITVVTEANLLRSGVIRRYLTNSDFIT